MKILSLTAGAAGMYCGTCMRDNSLARELLREGHEVLLVPIYTPTLTDEPNVSEHKVFFGGISVYLQQHVPLFRKLPAFLDKLWDSNWALNLASGRSIPNNPKLLGELTVSTLEAETGPLAKEVRKLTGWLRHEALQTDVIELPYTLVIGLARPLKKALNRPVVCTLQGEDLFLDSLKEPWRSQALDLIRQNIPYVDCFVAVSRYYADYMSGYLKIPRDRIQVSPLGINMDGFDAPGGAEQPGPQPKLGSEFRLGYFGRVAPEKGLHVLVEAFRQVRRKRADVTLHVAGYLPGEQKKYLERCQEMEPFTYHGAPDRAGKIAFLRSLDLFSLPVTYAEPKGLSVLEAMACGVPVVEPRRGALPELLERAGGGVLVRPEDPAALAEAICRLLDDPTERRRLGAAGWAGVREHFSVSRMARRTLEVYASVVSPGLAARA